MHDDAWLEFYLDAQQQMLEQWRAWQQGVGDAFGAYGLGTANPFELLDEPLAALLEAQRAWLREWAEQAGAALPVETWSRHFAELEAFQLEVRGKIFDTWLDAARSLDWAHQDEAAQQSFAGLQSAFRQAVAVQDAFAAPPPANEPSTARAG